MTTFSFKKRKAEGQWREESVEEAKRSRNLSVTQTHAYKET